MNIVEALKSENLRISSHFNRWMYFEGSMWKVVERPFRRNRINILIETENEEEAISVLLAD